MLVLHYPACTAHAPHYVVCDVSGSTIFVHIISFKRHDFRAKQGLLNKNVCFDFLIKIL